MSVDYLRMFLTELFVFGHLRSIALADAVPRFNGFHHQHDALAATGANLWVSSVEHLERSERIDEIEDRLMETYLRKGYSKKWINQRLKSIEVRKELTDEWEKRGVQKGQEYAILTDEITKAWSGCSTKICMGL